MTNRSPARSIAARAIVALLGAALLVAATASRSAPATAARSPTAVRGSQAIALASAARRWRSYPTRIVVSEKFPAVHGALHSRSAFCSARRRLLVYRARRGRANKLVGRGWSHRSGAWRVSLGSKLGQGHYYVIATGRASRAFGIRCPRARSKIIPVE